MLRYTQDRDLFSGKRYPTVEQPGQIFSQENPVFVVLISVFFQFFFFISSFVYLFLKGDAKYAIDISLALSKILTSV